jgi:predicted metal-dependent hydrolase
MSAYDEFPPEFWQGVEQFNSGQFYDCHDTLEAIWLECYGTEKKFYQGILQIAVACYHLSNLNWRGCAILLGEGMSRLGQYPADYAGIDVDALIDRSQEMLTIVQRAGESGVSQVARDYGLVSDPLMVSEVERSLPYIKRVSI